MNKRLLSRRTFLQGSAVFAGTVALGGVAGCSPGGATASGSGASAEMVPGTYTTTVHGHNGDFDVSVQVGTDVIEGITIADNDETYFVGTHSMDQVQALILEQQTPNVDAVSGATFSTTALIAGVKDALEQAGATNKSFSLYEQESKAYGDTSTQVAVVGSGSAGLAATMQSYQQGLDVILIEQLGIIGGSSGRAGYYVGGGTKIAKENGDDYSAEDFTNMLVESNPDQPELSRLFGERAGESIDWLVDMGMDQIYYDKDGNYGKGTHWGDYGHIGGFMTYAMQDQLDANGIDYRLNTKAKSLVKEGDRVVGIEVETDGQTYTISADAVVLATGGYARNAEMISEYTPELSGYSADASIGADGSGMLMAQEVGAELENMSDVFYYYGENVMYNGVPRNLTFPYLTAGVIVVNEGGKRFIDETTYYLKETVDAFSAQTGRHGFVLLNQDQADALIKPALDYAADLPAFYTECQSIEEVAQAMGINAAALEDTVKKYNAFVDAQNDEDFQKPAMALTAKYESGPFYVAEVQPCAHMTYGGIKADRQMHALDEAGKTIPGLYATGECTHVMLNGIGTNTIALIEGRVAAEQIMQDLQ